MAKVIARGRSLASGIPSLGHPPSPTSARMNKTYMRMAHPSQSTAAGTGTVSARWLVPLTLAALYVVTNPTAIALVDLVLRSLAEKTLVLVVILCRPLIVVAALGGCAYLALLRGTRGLSHANVTGAVCPVDLRRLVRSLAYGARLGLEHYHTECACVACLDRAVQGGNSAEGGSPTPHKRSANIMQSQATPMENTPYMAREYADIARSHPYGHRRAHSFDAAAGWREWHNLAASAAAAATATTAAQHAADAANADAWANTPGEAAMSSWPTHRLPRRSAAARPTHVVPHLPRRHRARVGDARSAIVRSGSCADSIVESEYDHVGGSESESDWRQADEEESRRTRRNSRGSRDAMTDESDSSPRVDVIMHDICDKSPQASRRRKRTRANG